MSEPQQDGKRLINDNKENIPKSKADSLPEEATTVDMSGFQPVVKRDKKNKKVERQQPQHRIDEEVKTSSSQRSKRNKSKDKSDKPRKKNGEEKSSSTEKNDMALGDADSATREDDKKVKFVEAPLPKDNPWAKTVISSSAVSDVKYTEKSPEEVDVPKPAVKVQKVTNTVRFNLQKESYFTHSNRFFSVPYFSQSRWRA